MKNDDTFLNFLLKNKYVIVCLIIAFVLISTGIIKTIVNIAITVLVLMIAVYIGKKMQEDKDFLRKIFEDKKEK
ncbi:MAG: hypothetical protein RR922_03090 [Clostridia bacterium]